MAVHVNGDPVSAFPPTDDDTHSDINEANDYDTNVRLDLEDSIQSNLSDSGTEDDDSVYRFDKKSTSYGSARRFFNKSSAKTWKGSRKSATEDSSKEYFTLQFDDEDDEDDKEMGSTERVPAKKGKSLKDSIETLLLNRGIDFNTHSVFVESSKTPLPLAFDTFPLGGNVLHVKENQSMQVDERIITLMKSAEDDKRMQSQRPKKNIMPSIFNEGVEVAVMNNKQAMARKSGITTGYKQDEIRTLSDLLNNYSFNMDTDQVDGGEGKEGDVNDTYLEESWTEVITVYEGMSNQDKIQQETIWELLITERNYLRKIRVIIVVFKNCLVRIQKDSNFLGDVDIQKLFSNIAEVYHTNKMFWENHLRPVTKEARTSKKPIKPSQLKDSFSSFEELFQPYIKYCMEEASCVKYLKQLKRDDEVFQEYLAWCETHGQCMRLKLADLFVKPMQRVTKYALLLKAILGKTSEEEEKTVLENMISEVDKFVTKINTTLRLRNEQQKLEDVLERIETYNPIEAANEEVEKILETHYSRFDLTGNIPGLQEEEQRCILLEGPMKMIEKQGRIDVHTFLFTDVIVLAKAKKGSDKFRIIRPPFRLNKVTVHKSKDTGAFILVYLNEYHVLVTAFTLQCAANEHTKWVSAIQRAKKRYEDARAAKGSTLAFFDDDLPYVATFSSQASPLPDRRSIISDDNRSLEPARDELRCRSTETVTRPYQKTDEGVFESHVKRSFSDPKAGINYSARERSSCKQKGRPRPKSLVNISDHDIATWVLTNENRNQSGSLTSDISDDSQRSSGIGDSFRSINSDVVAPYANQPEVSKVAQLKARFESNGCNSPINTEESDSSISSPSIAGLPESSQALPGCRRASPPDYMDEHPAIKEEEEQGTTSVTATTSNTVYADSDKETVTENCERIPAHALAYEYTGTSRVESSVDSAFQADREDSDNLQPPLRQRDFTVQCELLTDRSTDDWRKRSKCTCSCVTTENVTTSPDVTDYLILDKTSAIEAGVDVEVINLSDNASGNLDFNRCKNSPAGSNCDVMSSTPCKGSRSSSFESDFVHVSTQCDETMLRETGNSAKYLYMTCQSTMTELTTTQKYDISTQYEVMEQTTTKDSTTQCGTLVQLKANSQTDTCHLPSETSTQPSAKESPKRTRMWPKSLSDDGSSTAMSPFMDMLLQCDKPQSVHTPIKHSKSEANMGLVSDASSRNISHTRSRSDEAKRKSLPNSPENKRNNPPPLELKGMHALQTLTENLETIQKRLNSGMNPTPKHCTTTENVVKVDASDRPLNQDSLLVRCNSGSSLRKLALMKNSPHVPKKELGNSEGTMLDDDEGGDINDDDDTFDEDLLGQTPPALRRVSGSCIDKSDANKRFTWHDFDSLAALKGIEETKYGPDVGKAATFPLDKTLSKSSEVINMTSKKSSLKRSILRRFTHVLNRSDESESSSRKEKKKHKKEKRGNEKEERKRDSLVKTRSASVSSANSRFSLPLQLSSSNSFGSHASSTNSG